MKFEGHLGRLLHLGYRPYYARARELDQIDPVARCKRRSYMMIAADTVSFAGCARALAVLCCPKAGVSTRADEGESDGTGARHRLGRVLLRIASAQDRAAFAQVFAHFAPRVKAYLMKSGAAAALAEDCAQEVMATLWHKAHLFDPARASAATWIFTIARNKRIDAIRKSRRPEPEDLTWGPEQEPDQTDVLALKQDSVRLDTALAQLPENQRELIQLAYFGERSHSEIAEATGLPLGTIKSRIRLALDRLRHEMK